MPVRNRVHEGSSLTNAAATYLTFNPNLVEGGAITRNIILVNQSALTDVVVLVHVCPKSTSPAVSNCIIEYKMPAKSWANFAGPWLNNSEAYISALYQSAGSPDISMRIAAFEKT